MKKLILLLVPLLLTACDKQSKREQEELAKAKQIVLAGAKDEMPNLTAEIVYAEYEKSEIYNKIYECISSASNSIAKFESQIKEENEQFEYIYICKTTIESMDGTAASFRYDYVHTWRTFGSWYIDSAKSHLSKLNQSLNYAKSCVSNKLIPKYTNKCYVVGAGVFDEFQEGAKKGDYAFKSFILNEEYELIAIIDHIKAGGGEWWNQYTLYIGDLSDVVY